MNDNNTLLTPKELAARLRVSTTTITSWRRRGVIPCIRVSATVYRFDYGEVLEALKGRSRANVASTA